MSRSDTVIDESAAGRGFCIGDWTIDPDRLTLQRPDGIERKVTPRAMAVLRTLAEASGSVVHKNDLMDAVWPRAEVTEGVLSQAVSELRSALDDDSKNPRFIETIRNVGFRLIPAVTPAGEDGSGSAPLHPADRTRRPVRWLVGIAVIALLLFVAALVVDRPPQRPDLPAEPSLLVFPFEDLSPAGDHAYLARGMAEEIAVQLASSPKIRLVSNRVFAPYLAEGEDPARLARELDVDLVLTGSVQAREDSIRLIAELSDARSAEQLWISTFNRPLGDIFEIQDDVARVIADLLLQRGLLPQRAAPTPNLTAYDYYLQGRKFLAQIDPGSTGQAIELFREALALDSDFAAARSSLAQGLAMQGFLFQRGEPLLTTALEHAEEAIAQNGRLADAHYAKALALMGLARFEASRAAILEAVALSPNHIDAVFLGGILSDFRGRLIEAVQYYRRTLELNPRFWRTVAFARVLLLLGREEEALEVGRRGVRLAPGPPTLYFAHLLTLAEKHEEAMAHCAEALARHVPRARNLCGFSALLAEEFSLAELLLSQDWQENPRAQWGPFTFAPSATHLAWLRQAAGQTASAEAMLKESEEVTRSAMAAGNDHWALNYNLAAIAALQGDAMRANVWLETAYESGFRDHRLLALDPALDPIRETPQFLALQRRIGFDMVQAAEQLGWAQ